MTDLRVHKLVTYEVLETNNIYSNAIRIPLCVCTHIRRCGKDESRDETRCAQSAQDFLLCHARSLKLRYKSRAWSPGDARFDHRLRSPRCVNFARGYVTFNFTDPFPWEGIPTLPTRPRDPIKSTNPMNGIVTSPSSFFRYFTQRRFRAVIFPRFISLSPFSVLFPPNRICGFQTRNQLIKINDQLCSWYIIATLKMCAEEIKENSKSNINTHGTT